MEKQLPQVTQVVRDRARIQIDPVKSDFKKQNFNAQFKNNLLHICLH